MIPVKPFLEEECENIRRQLNDALRHDYGHEGSKDFYEECLVRLKHTRDSLAATSASELDKLAPIQRDLSDLSALISRIERSAYSEFSWPFAEELKELAQGLCTEKTLKGDLPPAIHILSEGGLDAYAIWAERNRPKGALRKILTIIFPTTLKHSVLLHPILGHEVGHAIYAVPKHQSALKQLLAVSLVSAGPMQSPDEVDKWLLSATAPSGIKSLLAKNGLTSSPICDDDVHASWIEEFLCDFVGVVLFGPSFVAAQLSLLLGMVPDGMSFGWYHPPVITRINAVLDAAAYLKLNDTSALSGASKLTADKFWADAQGKRESNPWATVFTAKQVGDLVDGLVSLFASLVPQSSSVGAYSGVANSSVFQRLFSSLTAGVPPAATTVAKDGAVDNVSVDFRDILYAGWLAHCAQVNGLSFHRVNRLCDLALLQQRAVKRYKGP